MSLHMRFHERDHDRRCRRRHHQTKNRRGILGHAGGVSLPRVVTLILASSASNNSEWGAKDAGRWTSTPTRRVVSILPSKHRAAGLTVYPVHDAHRSRMLSAFSLGRHLAPH